MCFKISYSRVLLEKVGFLMQTTMGHMRWEIYMRVFLGLVLIQTMPSSVVALTDPTDGKYNIHIFRVFYML